MKKIIGLTAVAFLSCAGAYADSLLTCRDGTGHEIYQGYVGSEKETADEKITREQDVPFTFAVSAKPAMGLDRATFTRKTGVVLKDCMGPYAKIYEKQEAGKFRCASGKIKAMAEIGAEDSKVLESLGLPQEEAACSVIFPKEKMLGLPASR
ncbi:MAG: hypothetical protein ACXWQO_02925 [Bdellovibrionota bacterium]